MFYEIALKVLHGKIEVKEATRTDKQKQHKQKMSNLEKQNRSVANVFIVINSSDGRVIRASTPETGTRKFDADDLTQRGFDAIN